MFSALFCFLKLKFQFCFPNLYELWCVKLKSLGVAGVEFLGLNCFLSYYGQEKDLIFFFFFCKLLLPFLFYVGFALYMYLLKP